MAFTELNTVENLVRDRLSRGDVGWTSVPGRELDRGLDSILVEGALRDALIRLNPEIAADPDRADELLYRLRAILVSVRTDGLVRANEEFRAWLVGERSMPFGENNAHVPIRLIDFDDVLNNDLVVSTQVTFTVGAIEQRFDLVLWVNGIPLVVGEAKTPKRPAVTWLDGATQIHDRYEQNVPAFFVPNVLSFATEGKELYFGAIAMPLQLWAPWRPDGQYLVGLSGVERAAAALLAPGVVLDILRSFTVFATDKKHRKIKIIPRYQQYYTTNQIVDRVVAGRIRKGLIWHFQGSGKSLLMVFAAQKLRLQPELRSPTVLVVVDRVDLDTQITSTFNAADIPNTVTTERRSELQTMLRQGVRKIVITTIHKFAEAEGVLDDRDNIIVLVDEAHRTQEGDLGRRMREALPNAFLFGLTGTPINKRDRNTFWAFGAEEDEHGYMSRYSFEESIRDRATLPLHFEPRLVELHVDREAIDEGFEAIAAEEGLSETDRALLSQRGGHFSRLVKAPERLAAITADIAGHFQEHVQPNGFKAQIVCFDREACVLYKNALDEILPEESSAVVMTLAPNDPPDWRTRFDRDRDEEEALLDRFRDPDDPLEILIVTARLLTGFDAPILQTMYLDKPLRDHTLLQAICRTNRPSPRKSHGLIVDYLGVFDDVSAALAFDDASVRAVITNIAELKDKLPGALQACLDFFPGVDRTVEGYEGLLAAQECLPDNDTRDGFGAAYSYLAQHWEAISPDAFLAAYRSDFVWLTDVYQSVQPPSGQGRLIWHALGAKTSQLIADHVHVDVVRDDLETIVLDADVLEDVLLHPDPTKTKEIEVKILYRLRKHGNDPRFVALGERLEQLRDKHLQGQLTSIEFLKSLLELARDVVEAEREIVPADEIDRGRAALTELFESVKNDETPIVVERVVDDIDDIVRVVRFEGWQQTTAGEREVQRALRRALLKYKLHRDQELFEKAYGYIKQYY
ncbi:MAG TPA: HsdR family type I site-specific deoxyribonuclease [Gaiellaceae bacterium]|nr:HsdR family type I site-specific deoxyribonuclease [Gaiellaceae bacterium]